jgi:tellurite resistance protein
MIALSRSKLEPLRDALRARGQRPSLVLGPNTSVELLDAMELVNEWGSFVEAMYLMMAVDRRVMNVEREVLRGALAVLSNERVRTRHMEAMLDAATRNVGAEGTEARLAKVIAALHEHPVKAESAVVVAAAIAAADDRVVPEEHALLERFMRELEIEPQRAQEILAELGQLSEQVTKEPNAK